MLRRVARILPREFRERVFEPALSDIQLDDASVRRPLARAILIVECVRLAIPQYFWRGRRPTKLAVGLIVVLVLGTLVRARYSYAAEWRASQRSVGASPRVATPAPDR